MNPPPDRQDPPESAAPNRTILQMIEAESGASPRVILPDEPSTPGGSPLLKPAPEFGPMLPRGAGGYQVLGEIARGGMGLILRGHDTDLGRDVALKVLLDDLAAKPAVVQRFVEEAQIGGQLQHPGIVPVYELGLMADKRPFFAMKLVKGRTLAALLTERTEPSQDRRRYLGIFEQVCQTMAYAHARSVIHRDLKPANIMVGSFGEVQVLDWGLAKVRPRGGVADASRALQGQVSIIETVRSGPDSDGSDSLAGSVMGTLAYMPPEQARGEVDRLDERSDVFSLGAILCEILTGAPPYRGTPEELVVQASMAKLDDATQRLDACGADAELVSLAKRCLAPAPAARPRDAGVVAKEIGAFLSSVEERARSAQIAAAEERVKTQAERRARRLTLALATSVVAILTVGGGGWLWVEQGQRDRMAATASTVAEVLSAAQRLRGEAQAAPVGDLSRWDAALAEVGRAEALTASAEVSEATKRGVGDLVLELREGRAEAQQRADAKLRDDEMLGTLSEIRIPPDEASDIDVFGKREGERRDAAYTAAFRKYGLAVDELSAEEAIRRIQPSPAAASLAIALDDWALARWTITRWTAGKDWTTWVWILQVARGIDPDENRCKLRDRIASGSTDVEILKALAAGEESSRWPAATLLLLAQTLYAANSRDVAVDVLRKAQRAHPDDFEVNMMLGLFLIRISHERQDFDEALRYFTAARALRPRSIGVLVQIAGAMVNNERPDAAIAVCRDALAMYPDSLGAHHVLGVALLNKQDYEAAERELRRAIEIDGSGAELHIHLAIALGHRGLHDEALSEARRAVELEPSNAGAHHELGMFLHEAGDLEGAIAELHRALELDPSLAKAHNDLGSLFMDKEDLDGAMAEFRRALELTPTFALAQNNIGVVLAHRGDVDGALAACRRAVELDPSDSLCHRNLGDMLRQKGDLDAALTECRRAVELDPKSADAHAKLGFVLKAKGDHTAAASAFRKAAELEPNSAYAHDNLADALMAVEDIEGAIAEYKTAVQLEPDSEAHHADLGVALVSADRAEEALNEFQRAAELGATNPKLYCTIGVLLFDQGDADGALAATRRSVELGHVCLPSIARLVALYRQKGETTESLQRTVERDPDDFPLRVAWIFSLYQAGDMARVIEELRTLIRLKPDSASAHTYLGHALSRGGNEDEAMLAYARAIELDPDAGEAQNGLAWLLATCKEESRRDAAASLEHARRAVALDVDNLEYLSTLGAARYRTGDWKGCVEAIEKAETRNLEDHGADWLFLAMASERLGEHDAALEWYRKASETIDPKDPVAEPLVRLQEEAAHVLERALKLPR